MKRHQVRRVVGRDGGTKGPRRVGRWRGCRQDGSRRQNEARQDKQRSTESTMMASKRAKQGAARDSITTIKDNNQVVAHRQQGLQRTRASRWDARRRQDIDEEERWFFLQLFFPCCLAGGCMCCVYSKSASCCCFSDFAAAYGIRDGRLERDGRRGIVCALYIIDEMMQTMRHCVYCGRDGGGQGCGGGKW
jgi:hypothetical protein